MWAKVRPEENVPVNLEAEIDLKKAMPAIMQPYYNWLSMGDAARLFQEQQSQSKKKQSICIECLKSFTAEQYDAFLNNKLVYELFEKKNVQFDENLKQLLKEIQKAGIEFQDELFQILVEDYEV